GAIKYYAVGSTADLIAAINSIAGQIISCTFSLSAAPPDPSLVTVTADGQTVPRDPSHMNGWDFGANNRSITFYGMWCSRIQSGSVMTVVGVFGCPPVSISGGCGA